MNGPPPLPESASVTAAYPILGLLFSGQILFSGTRTENENSNTGVVTFTIPVLTNSSGLEV